MPLRAPTRRRWTLRRPEPETVRALMRSEGLDEVLATLLANRGITDSRAAREHLTPSLERLHDPFQLPGMRAATRRLARAIADQETILVHGDYDVDGVTGTALLVRLFRHLGADVAWHVPNRFTDGYSFGDHSLRRAAETNATLVVSVDNGTSATTTITQLAERNVDTIVTDHHEPPRGPLPPAVAIVNPKLEGSRYPFRELCGGAVAFKLAWGLCQEVTGETRVRRDLREFLVDAMAYVAIATVCDVVPLVDENRILAHFGLRALRRPRHAGLQALIEVAGLHGRPLAADDVGYQIGPRINASGRLETAARAVEVLLAEDVERARSLAAVLDELNQSRRAIERELVTAALAEAERFEDPERWPVVVVAGGGWHQGVVGIAAARLAETCDRPALVVGIDGDRARGSARSVPGFDVLEALHGAADVFERYGGHAQAAGCELAAADVDAAREAINERARELLRDTDTDGRSLTIDAEIALGTVTPELMTRIERLEPFGERNERPLFVSRDLRLAEPARVVGQDDAHLLLRLRRGPVVLKALAFGQGKRASELDLGLRIDAVHSPRWNVFRGERSLELVLSDFRVEG